MSGYTVRPERNVRRSLPGAQAVYNKTGCLNMRTACFLTLQVMTSSKEGVMMIK